jgi:hypothetical protein
MTNAAMCIEVRATGRTAPYGIGERIACGMATTGRGIDRIVARARGIAVRVYIVYNCSPDIEIVRDCHGEWTRLDDLR